MTVLDIVTMMSFMQSWELNERVNTLRGVGSYHKKISLIEGMREIIAWSAGVLEGMRSAHGNVDALAFTGVSGASVGFTVSYMTGVQPMYVRKPDDRNHHSHSGVEGVHLAMNIAHVREPARIVIIDDFVDRGSTLLNIMTLISEQFPDCPFEIVGVIMFSSGVATKTLSATRDAVAGAKNKGVPVSLCDAAEARCFYEEND